jgi:predicted transcriptional regulator
LIEALHDAGQDDEASKVIGADAARIDEFAEKFPGWAQLIAKQGARIAQLETLIDGLNDRLTHDPVLSETMHDVLSTVSAIRSTASILVATPDIDAEWRQRFHNTIETDSRRLAETSAAMAEHFEHLTQSSAAYVAPLDALQALFETHNHHFPEIEQEGDVAIAGILERANLTSIPAQDMARRALSDYATRAAAMPHEELVHAVRNEGFMMLGSIATDFKVGLDNLMLRLSELAHTTELPEMGCVQCDGAGALITRNALPDFPLPRFGAACNLWPLFAALNAPGHPLRQTIQTNDGGAFTTYSLAQQNAAPGFGMPPIYIATMLIVADAPTQPDLKIGAACRVCPQKTCAARREPTILETFTSQTAGV